MMDKNGETPILKAEMLYKFSPLKFCEGAFEEAYKILGECSQHLLMKTYPKIKKYIIGLAEYVKSKVILKKLKVVIPLFYHGIGF